MLHVRTAQEWKAEVEKAIEVPGEKEWEAIWKRIERSEEGHIEVTNDEEGRKSGEGLDYLLEVVEREIDSYYYYTSLNQVPRLPSRPHLEVPRPTQPKEREISPDMRFWALSQIVAVLADKEEAIRAFREEVLGGRLLKVEEVPTWIESIEKKEGYTRNVRLTFKVNPENWEEEVMEELRALAMTTKENLSSVCKTYGYAGLPFRSETLSYIDRESEIGESMVFINERGTLGRLKQLAKEYQTLWPEAWTVHFILTGEVAPVYPGSTGIALDYQYEMHRIKLSVSPHLTGDEVRSLYLEERERLFQIPFYNYFFPAESDTSRKGRRLTEKHARLAVFNIRTPGPWSWKLRKWNQKYPDWKYKHPSTFRRDCQAAYERITGWAWESRELLNRSLTAYMKSKTT